MAYRVEVDREPAKLLRSKRLPGDARMRLALAIKEMEEDPRAGDTRHLKGEYHCFWRRRVGDYRIIYTIIDSEELVRVVEICHRSSCY
ncbi:MAG: type II toxin-antitoxin system RelE/ParE family toxin [Desulfurococcales archaeon]|nr:type II toxin-antitoxin system RelE/ParE family toxin [Desulfurococcales archaeon]